MRQKKLLKTDISEEDAVKFLENRGYSVLKEDLKCIEKIPNIIEYFYSELNKLYSTLGYEEVVVIRSKIDEKEINKYIKNNLQIGVTKKQAICNLISILKLFFKYYSELGLEKPITNLKFLLTDGSWILDKIRTVHRSKIEQFRESIEMQEWRNRLYEQEDDILLKLREKRHKELLKQ